MTSLMLVAGCSVGDDVATPVETSLLADGTTTSPAGNGAASNDDVDLTTGEAATGQNDSNVEPTLAPTLPPAPTLPVVTSVPLPTPVYSLCTVVLPREPADDATGAVSFDFGDQIAEYAYQALWVVGADGTSALTAGEPAVVSGDVLEFFVDESMYARDGSGLVSISINGEQQVACAVELVDQPSVTASDLSNGGY